MRLAGPRPARLTNATVYESRDPMKLLVRACGVVLAALVYVLLVLPAGLVARLVRDPLRRRPDPGAPSYWIHFDAGPSGQGAGAASAGGR